MAISGDLFKTEIAKKPNDAARRTINAPLKSAPTLCEDTRCEIIEDDELRVADLV
jgi:hypothetical protein